MRGSEIFKIIKECYLKTSGDTSVSIELIMLSQQLFLILIFVSDLVGDFSTCNCVQRESAMKVILVLTSFGKC